MYNYLCSLCLLPLGNVFKRYSRMLVTVYRFDLKLFIKSSTTISELTICLIILSILWIAAIPVSVAHKNETTDGLTTQSPYTKNNEKAANTSIFLEENEKIETLFSGVIEENFIYLRPNIKFITKETKFTKYRKKKIHPRHDFTEEINCALGITKQKAVNSSFYSSLLDKRTDVKKETKSDNDFAGLHINANIPSKINVFTVLCYLGPSARTANNTIKKIYETLEEKKLEKFHIKRSFQHGNYIVNIGIFFSFLEAVKFIYQSRKFKIFSVKKIKIPNNKDFVMKLLKN